MIKIRLKIKSFLLQKIFKSKIKLHSLVDNFYSIKKKSIKPNSSTKIYISISLWGKEYIEIFNKVLIPSLLQGNNIPKLYKENYQIKFFIFAKNNEEIFEKQNKNLLEKYSQIEIINNEIVSDFNNNEKNYLKNCLTFFINKSITDNAYSMIITPDHVYGNGSIYNLFKLVEGKDIGIGCIGARINWNSFKKLKVLFEKNLPISNRELVKFTMKNLHPAQKQCIGINSIFLDNFSIEELDNNFIVSSSRINVCIVKFLKSDLYFFKKTNDYNQIDFSWPRVLVKEGRYKLIGDSDLVFYSELTKENLKFSKIDHNKEVHHLYAKNQRLLNHIVNDSFYSTWKI